VGYYDILGSVFLTQGLEVVTETTFLTLGILFRLVIIMLNETEGGSSSPFTTRCDKESVFRSSAQVHPQDSNKSNDLGYKLV